LKGVTLREKSALLAFDVALKAMKSGEIPEAVEKLTVRQWLTGLGLSKNFQTRFFDPAAIGILNDKPEVASAAGFIQALREMFFTGRDSSRFALAKTGLSELYVGAAKDYIEKRGGRVLTGVKAAGLIFEFGEVAGGRVGGAVTERAEMFEAGHVVSSLPPWDLKKIARPAPLRGPWDELAPAPIVGATLKLDRPVMNERFIGLLNTETHWVFNKSLIHRLTGEGQILSVVISGAHDQLAYSPEKILQAAVRDLSSCLPEFSKARVLASKVVKEPFATLSPVPGSEAKRPIPAPACPASPSPATGPAPASPPPSKAPAFPARWRLKKFSPSFSSRNLAVRPPISPGSMYHAAIFFNFDSFDGPFSSTAIWSFGPNELSPDENNRGA